MPDAYGVLRSSLKKGVSCLDLLRADLELDVDHFGAGAELIFCSTSLASKGHESAGASSSPQRGMDLLTIICSHSSLSFVSFVSHDPGFSSNHKISGGPILGPPFSQGSSDL